MSSFQESVPSRGKEGERSVTPLEWTTQLTGIISFIYSKVPQTQGDHLYLGHFLETAANT